MIEMNYRKNMPAWARWPLYAMVGVFVLNVVQGFDDTSLLTAEGTTRAMLRWGVPILLAGLGGLFAERAGVVNIGLEGMMILGTWFGAWGALQFGPWWGLLLGAVGGGLGGLLHAIATVQFGVDHVISGVRDQHPRPGGCAVPSSEVFAKEFKDAGGSITQSPRVPTVGRFTFPFLAGGDLFGWKTPNVLGWFEKKDWFFVSDIAGIARGLTSNMSWVTLFALFMVPFSAWLLWRTRFGLRLRICGERPEAGEAQGVNIYFFKYVGVIISGTLSGLGGAFIASQELSGIYKEGQTTGRGFIGLAALIFGNWRPCGHLRRRHVVRLSVRAQAARSQRQGFARAAPRHRHRDVRRDDLGAVAQEHQRRGARRSVRWWPRWRGTCSPRPRPTGGPRSCRT